MGFLVIKHLPAMHHEAMRRSSHLRLECVAKGQKRRSKALQFERRLLF